MNAPPTIATPLLIHPSSHPLILSSPPSPHSHPTSPTSLTQVTVHGGVCAVIYVDFITGHVKASLIHAVFPVSVGLFYHMFAGILYLASGLWFYPFLSLSGRGWPIVYIVFILLFLGTTALCKYVNSLLYNS